MFAVKAKIYGLLYNQSSSIAFDELSSYWSAPKSSLFLGFSLVTTHRGGRGMRWCCVNFQRRGVLLIVMIVGQGPTALAVGAGGCCLDIFSLIYHVSFLFLSLSLWGGGPI